MEPFFFAGQKDLRKWFEKNHDKKAELWVGFHKVKSGHGGITWSQSVDEAICFGWIDGIRKSIDANAYVIRFSPRKKTSIWSAVNIGKAETMIRLGLMKPTGQAAFEKRTEERSKIYSFEQAQVTLNKPLEVLFKKNKKAFAFFNKTVPSYRKAAIWWVISAKQETTRFKRLNQLIKDSEQGEHLKHLKRNPVSVRVNT